MAMRMTSTINIHKTRLIGSAALLPVGLVVALALLALAVAISITQGAADLSLDTVRDALFAYDITNLDHLILRTVRVPRVVAGVIVGAGLGVAGAIMQGLTGNPLASPDILGINAGAAFAVVVGITVLGGVSLFTTGILAIIGATLAAVLVYGLSSLGRAGATPVKLTLAGVIFAVFISSFTTAILIFNRDTFDQIRFWSVGSLAGRSWEMVFWLGPFVAAGLLGAVLMSRQITTSSLGQDIAKGLGQNIAVVRGAASAMTILMAGGAVAIAGPVGFVGLIIPHMVRVICGVDYRWIVPYSAVAGAILVTVADTLGRVLLRPQEIPVGVMLAFVGAPFFIYLARWKIK